jgi:MFS family permease
VTRSRHKAVAVYVVIRVLGAFSSTVYFSVVPLYRIRTAGLGPLQLVLVGTFMEAAVFVSEIPTGVVADTVSRRRSVLIGHAGMAASLAMETSLPNFPSIVVAQVLWGISYTFTSGATEAWLSGELGAPSSDELSLVFLRAARWSSGAALVGIPVAFALAALDLRVPLYVGAAVELGTLSCVAGLVVPPLVARLRPALSEHRLTVWVVALYLGQVLGVAVFGVTTTFVVAVAAVVVVDRAHSVRETLMAAWISPLTEATHRATILSTFSQFDAVGQVGFGPVLGLVASDAGVPTALVVSAAIMAPVAVALAAAGRSMPPAAPT